MDGLAGPMDVDWDAIQSGGEGRFVDRAIARPILDGLHALACELNANMALGASTGPALAFLEHTGSFLRDICLNQAEAGSVGSAGQLSYGGLAGWQIRSLAAFVDAHLGEKLCLTELAGAVRLSPSYLCRACRQSFRCSPMQYVMQRRVLAAKHLLKHSQMTLSELALNCGFADQAHFTRVFRGSTGVTPRRWRRMWQMSGAGAPAAGTPPRSPAYLAS